MAKRDRNVLKSFFEAGVVPTQSNFEDLIDSALNQQEDRLEKTPDAITAYAQGDPSRSLLRIDQSRAKIGIGADLPENPNSLLYIKGNSPQLTLEGLDSCYMALYPEGYDKEADENNQKGWLGFDGADQDFNIVNQKAGSSLHFYTRAVEEEPAKKQLTIKPDGRIGLRNDNPKASLQIGDRWTLQIETATNSSVIGYNNYQDTETLKMGSGASSQLRFENNGWISIRKGEDDQKGAGQAPLFSLGQLRVGPSKGAFISAGTPGALFGSNLYVDSDLDDRDNAGRPRHVFKTVANSNDNYGYAAMRADQGKIFFYTQPGNTKAGEKVAIEESLRMLIDEQGKVGIGLKNPQARLQVNGDICGKGMLLLNLIAFDDKAPIITLRHELDPDSPYEAYNVKIPVYIPKGVKRIGGKIRYTATGIQANPFKDGGLEMNLDLATPGVRGGFSTRLQFHDYYVISLDEDFSFSQIPLDSTGKWNELVLEARMAIGDARIYGLFLYIEE